MNTIELAAANHSRVHFIGICGIMMSALALELHRRGAVVTGNDRDDSPKADMLRANGISVSIGHKPEYVEGADIIVRNAAIHDSSPDIIRARELGIPILERPDVLGQLMSEYPHSIGVSGTHGKSTTSGLITHALIECGKSPTAFLGADMTEIGGAYTLGNREYFVAESCEYCESFLYLAPETAVILNVEPDHLDYYQGIEAIKRAFRAFAEKTPASGRVVYNADNKNAVDALSGLDRETLTFGIHNGRFRAVNLKACGPRFSFDVADSGDVCAHIDLKVFGLHNVYNSLAAFAALRGCGIEPKQAAAAISSFVGIKRRMEYVGTRSGASVYDDYAHHPDELRATLTALRALPDCRRLICVFQPHTYSRTRALMNEFAASLALADKCLLIDIYAAREQNTFGVSSAELASLVPGAEYCPSFDELRAKANELVKPGDVVVYCGAGTVTDLSRLDIDNI